ncbi:MAG: 5-formyltetrahydrofolate cyclo-ligase [Candidatus Micrarchaeota archaeon]
MVKHLKDELRKEILEKRSSLSKDEVITLSISIAKNLFEQKEFTDAKVVGFYLPKGNEVDTRKMIEYALEKKKEIVVPVTDSEVKFYKFISFDDLIPGKFNVLEPKTRILPSKEPDLIITPGVCFGLCMHRVGYGKGYYDVHLSKSKAYRIGICYDFQVVEKLPTHAHDQKMNCIITEKRIICSSKEGQD